MTFAWPHLLWLLIVPAFLLGRELVRRRRAAGTAVHPKILRAEVGTHQVTLARDLRPRIRSGARPWLALGLAFAIGALARPQWGRIEEPVFEQAREILVAVDLSRSMLAPDVKPSRLDRAKLLIQGLLDKLRGERVGLVVFSGTAFLQSPLSADYEILREFLPALGPDFLPEGGTNYRALIDSSIDAFSSSGAADRFLIILSDGEATDDSWKAQADELKRKGVHVLGLGIGTAAGTMIPDGSGGFVKDQRGAVVLSKLESGTLQQLAEVTGGVYRDASTWIDLAGLIEDTVNAGRKGDYAEKRTARLIERFQWPLALAVWCLLVSFYYEFPVRPRTRDVALRTPPGGGDAAAREQGAGSKEQEAETRKPDAEGPKPEPARMSRERDPSQPASGPHLPFSALRLLPSVLWPPFSTLRPLASAFLLLAPCSLLLTPPPASAAVKVAPPAPPATAPAAPNAAPQSPIVPLPPKPPVANSTGPSSAPEAPPLARIVGRLSNADVRTARDWAELAQETVLWGSRLQSAQKPVPEGPVRDALAAVDLGSRLDAKTADWPKLREELEALLQKQEKPPEQQNQQDQQNQDKQQNRQDQDQQKQSEQQDRSQSGSPQQQNQPPPANEQPQKPEAQPNEQPKSQDQPRPEERKSDQSVFGDMQKQPPPPPASETQKIGGARDEKHEPKEPVDPALAAQLGKLEQLKDKDSPTQLFQMMQSERSEASRKKPEKDW